jgi:hypothetical protein
MPNYYLSVVKRHLHDHPSARVYMVTRSAHLSSPAVALLKRAGVHVLSRSAPEDFALLVRAKHIASSFGSFAWTAAFFSSATAVHMPYYGTAVERQRWWPWAALFVHDDPAYIYHEIDAPHLPSLSACQVLSYD